MAMYDSAVLDNPSKIRQTVVRLHAAAMLAGLALVLSLAAGCKQKADVQQPAARTDQQVTSDIQAKIQGETALAGQNIQVSVNNGVATLSGTVSDDASRALAGNDSGTVSGVRTVVNNLTVQPSQQASAAPAPLKEKRHEQPNHDRDRASAAAPPSQPAPAPPPAQPQPAPPVAAAPVAAAPAPPRPVVQQFTLDSGTVLPVILTENLTSKTAQPNDVFHASLGGDLISNGVVVVPRGSAILGRVTDVKEAAHFKGNSLLM